MAERAARAAEVVSGRREGGAVTGRSEQEIRGYARQAATYGAAGLFQPIYFETEAPAHPRSADDMALLRERAAQYEAASMDRLFRLADRFERYITSGDSSEASDCDQHLAEWAAAHDGN